MARANNALDALEGWKPVTAEALLSFAPDYVVMPETGARGTGGALSYWARGLAEAGTHGTASERLIRRDGVAMLGFGPRTLYAALQLARTLHSWDPLLAGHDE